MWFEAISSLKINMEKNELILLEEVIDLKELAGMLGCRVGSLPTTYLGFPLEAPFKSQWDVVEERFQKWLIT